ncbi:MAG: hypothetical protein HF314_02095 [Ignavibacteria bacterium]|jgi:hypothetical protein|nr:hypothetical protein [Ignavibacteria bacterium]MCU7501836.1 hypothetical protein [Ignavibacteria bacterium]MCU7514818.1 hypothetical protein [Ignavibacteria bacterium]
MLKLKITAIITLILGVISLGWIFYDYLALTDIVYNYGGGLDAKRRVVTLGFIPIILFHFAFFITMYFLFDFLKKQKPVIKEHARLKAEELKAGQLKTEQQKAEELKSGRDKPEIPGKDMH